jgi:hypothetical protein
VPCGAPANAAASIKARLATLGSQREGDRSAVFAVGHDRHGVALADRGEQGAM